MMRSEQPTPALRPRHGAVRVSVLQMTLAKDGEEPLGQGTLFRGSVGIFVDIGEGEGGVVIGAGAEVRLRPTKILRVSELLNPTAMYSKLD